MAHSFSQVYLHVIFSTKGRAPFLADRELRQRTHAYLAGACKNLDSPALIIGGVEDHLHILCRQGKSITMANLVRELKRESSKWLKTQPCGSASFRWQQGYAAFSLSPGHVNALKVYIARQEEHHKNETFQDEFRRICKKYGLSLDERYAWD